MAVTKGQIAFLKKVRDREVRLIHGYTMRGGGYYRYVGGEVTTKKMQSLGLIRMDGVASLGRPAYAVLTEAGEAALREDPTQ